MTDTMTHPSVATRTPDDHLAELRELAREYEASAMSYAKFPASPRFVRRAAALRWILDQNAYGVEPSEVTT